MTELLKRELEEILNIDLRKREQELLDNKKEIEKLLNNASSRVISVLCCVTGVAGLAYGVLNFQFQGISSALVAITIALSLTLGAFLIFYGLWNYLRIFFHKPKTTLNKVIDELNRVQARLKEID
jgi:hypothetical protein